MHFTLLGPVTPRAMIGVSAFTVLISMSFGVIAQVRSVLAYLITDRNDRNRSMSFPFTLMYNPPTFLYPILYS